MTEPRLYWRIGPRATDTALRDAVERLRAVVREEQTLYGFTSIGHCHDAPPYRDEPMLGVCPRCEAWMAVLAALDAQGEPS